jgi:hypothetical protein
LENIPFRCVKAKSAVKYFQQKSFLIGVEAAAMRKLNLLVLSALILVAVFGGSPTAAQEEATNGKKDKKKQDSARPVTVPITIRRNNRVKLPQRSDEVLETGNLIVKENGELREILSLRATENSPLAFAVLIQDDSASQVNLELENIRKFIRNLPKGSRVMVAYLRGGTIDVRQKFTDDLEKAARSLRVINGSSIAAPFNPYVGIIEALQRFDNLPLGRRAMLVISDGLDISRGIDSAAPGLSLDLDRAILKAQRSGTAVYSIYAAATSTNNGNTVLVSYGQGSLNRLTDETGGRAFFQGTSTPVSFEPYLRELGKILSRQFALTFLSTGAKKDLRRIEIISDNPEIIIEYPRSYVPH